jgi:dolichol-phosphate mannosyltransferase
MRLIKNEINSKAENSAIDVSVVVPCHNEQEVVQIFLSRMEEVLEKMASKGELQIAEIIFVDDGSDDDTWSLISKFDTKHEQIEVVGVKLSRNFGHQAAITAGMEVSRGDFVLTIDADLQDPPEILPSMMYVMNQGNYDVVSGRRRNRPRETKFKLITAKLFYRVLNRLSEIEFNVDTGDFRLMSRRVVNAYLQLPESVRYARGLISWMGYPEGQIEYDRNARVAGETSYNLRKMVNLAVSGLIGFSTTPLRYATLLGATGVLFGLAMSLFSIISLLHSPVSGWFTTISVMILMSSICIAMLGLIGEYLGVLVREVKARPEYIVDCITTTR